MESNINHIPAPFFGDTRIIATSNVLILSFYTTDLLVELPQLSKPLTVFTMKNTKTHLIVKSRAIFR